MLVRGSAGLLGGLGVLLWSALAHAQCTKDTDCKGDRVCEAGACTAPAAAAPPPSVAAPPPAPAAPLGAEPAPQATQLPPPPPEPAPAAAAGSVVAPADERPADDAPVRRKRRSGGMMAGGIVMVSLAPLALLVAAVANSQQTTCEAGGSFDFDNDGFDSSGSGDCDKYDARIYGGLLTAAALTGVGIPLIVIGAKKVPVATASITPWATPRGAGLGLRLEL